MTLLKRQSKIFFSIQFLLALISSIATNINYVEAHPYHEQRFYVRIYNCHHPPREPNGLFICGFQTWDSYYKIQKSYQYRIYCPTKMVRNTTNGSFGESRYFTDEDRIKFGDYFVIRKVVSNVC